MVLAMDGILLEVFERVVHPAHVPFETEAEPAKVGGARDHGIGGGLLGVGLNVGMFSVGFEVEAAQELDGLEVFAAAEAVGNPLACFARVVEIEHGGKHKGNCWSYCGQWKGELKRKSHEAAVM